MFWTKYSIFEHSHSCHPEIELLNQAGQTPFAHGKNFGTHRVSPFFMTPTYQNLRNFMPPPIFRSPPMP